MTFNFTGLTFDFDADFNETMKRIELKYWDYLDNYDRVLNPFLTPGNFLTRIVQENDVLLPAETVRHFWRRYERYKRTIPTSGLIITCGDQLLLVKVYNSDIFGMPKGKHEPDESSVTAALREAHEETGLSITVEQLVNPNEPILINRTHFYRVHWPTCNTVFTGYNSNEIIDIQWLNLDQIIAQPQGFTKQVQAVATYLIRGIV